jgi:soluble calcium-activated nucleotidase 1
VSTEPFDEKKDSYRSGNKLIIASEDFTKIDVVEIGDKLTPERGYASFKFVPNTQDRVLMATKSVEVEDAQSAYVTLFQIDGTVLLHDVEIPGDSKYEGLAFTQY